MHLKGFLWSVGRSGTKAIIDSINSHTSARSVNWQDSSKLIESPKFFNQYANVDFVPTLHFPRLCGLYGEIVKENPELPVVYAVRDPISSIQSYADAFLATHISRQIDKMKEHEAKGGKILATFDHQLLDQLAIPSADIWGHYKAFKHSPHLIVEFSELGEASFVDTINRMNDFLGLETTSSVVWPGISNQACDKFLGHYRRTFQILDRIVELHFIRWDNYWPDHNLIKLGTLKSDRLKDLAGEEGELQVLAPSAQICTEDQWQFERDAFQNLLSDVEVVETLATQIVDDFNYMVDTVKREVPALKEALCTKFDKTQRKGVRRFLKEHPEYADLWPAYSERIKEKAA